MAEEIVINRTLTQNGVKHFILRFDLMPSTDIDFVKIINAISESADRTEKRTKTGIQLNIKAGKSEITKTQSEDYVLVNDTTRISITFSKDLKAFWLETNQYLDNSTYKINVGNIISAMNDLYPDIASRRIGMRFINDFGCTSLKGISRIYNKKLAKNIVQMASQDYVSRIIAHEEFNYSNYKLRVQYGIPNKYYPATINNYDLLLDIDAFDDTQHKLDAWNIVLNELNHLAYIKFIEVMNPVFLEELK